MNWKIHKVGPKTLKDYDGMNFYAAKAMNFRGYPMRKNTILVDKRLKPKRMKEIIRHEKIEVKKMKEGAGYWSAHRYALKHQGEKNG
jgi:hypothetical protein